MRVFASTLLTSSLVCGLGMSALAAKDDRSSGDTAPQLVSTKGATPRWKNVAELRQLAESGDPQACFQLGSRMLEGDDEISLDPTKARALLETAAQGGIADAFFRLGKIYHDGLGVPKDYAKALEYYTAAARRGVPEAQFNIGAMLVSGRGVKRNYVEGLAWLILAGHAGAISDAEARVRERLAKRPADIQAAETRAKELADVLENAVVHTGVVAPPTKAPPELKPPTRPPVPTTNPNVEAPKLMPLPPPKIVIPLEPPKDAPR